MRGTTSALKIPAAATPTTASQDVPGTYQDRPRAGFPLPMTEATWLLSKSDKTTHKPQQLAMALPSSPALEHMEALDSLVPDTRLVPTRKPKLLRHVQLLGHMQESTTRRRGAFHLARAVGEHRRDFLRQLQGRRSVDGHNAVVDRSLYIFYCASRNATREATATSTNFLFLWGFKVAAKSSLTLAKKNSHAFLVLFLLQDC